jgi:hypothetical protein
MQSENQALAAAWRTRGFREFVDIFLRKTETRVIVLLMTDATIEGSGTAPMAAGREKGDSPLRHFA